MKIHMICFALISALYFPAVDLQAQETGRSYVRIARLEIDPLQVEDYKAILKEEIVQSVRLEPGVLALRAVYDIKNPNHVTILEIYADKDAYNKHIQSPHFIKYKTSTSKMVKSLELTDVVPIALEAKPGS